MSLINKVHRLLLRKSINASHYGYFIIFHHNHYHSLNASSIPRNFSKICPGSHNCLYGSFSAYRGLLISISSEVLDRMNLEVAGQGLHLWVYSLYLNYMLLHILKIQSSLKFLLSISFYKIEKTSNMSFTCRWLQGLSRSSLEDSIISMFLSTL
jgi:hypothetical protein